MTPAERVTRSGRPDYLSCKRDPSKMRDYMNGRVTPPKQVTSPTWGPPPPCKQALSGAIIFVSQCSAIPGELESFRNYEEFRVIFPKILDAI